MICRKAGKLRGNRRFAGEGRIRMQFIIEEQVLQETLWEEGSSDIVLEIPEGVRHLGPYCLDSSIQKQTVPGLQGIVIPNTVEVIEADAFCDATQLMPFPYLHCVHFRGTLQEWCAIEKGFHHNFDAYTDIGLRDYDLYLLDDEGREYLAEHLVIPEPVTEIRACAFAGCTSLKSVTILGSIRLFACAFRDCPNLTRIRILGDLSMDDVWDCFVSGDQSPFDETEELEIAVSDSAAEEIIRREYFDLKNTPIRITLADREETLGEILEIVEFLQEEYHYKYDTPIGQDIIKTFRRHLSVLRSELRTESDSYDDESDAERQSGETDSDSLLPGGYHYDDRMALRTRIFHWLIVCYRKLHAYDESVHKLAEEVKGLRGINETTWPLRDLPDLAPLQWEAEELLDLIDEGADKLIERGVLDVSETVYDRIHGLLDLLEEILYAEEDLLEYYVDSRERMETEQDLSWDSFLEGYHMWAGRLIESADRAKAEVWEMLRAEIM